MADYCKRLDLLQQGAEAKLYETIFFGKPAILKERFAKSYRHPDIDKKLTHKRITQEVRGLQRCRKVGLLTPSLYFVDFFHNVIVLEKINGVTVREHVNATKKKIETDNYKELYPVAKVIGSILAKLHDSDIIHGDLTTSNMMITLNNSNNNALVTLSDVYLIDFGLSTSSSLAEDKAVDLYVLERAFLSSHPNSEDLFSELLDSYKNTSSKSKSVIAKLDEVRQRGRKRSMLG